MKEATLNEFGITFSLLFLKRFYIKGMRHAIALFTKFFN
jgi:hypothetical protein